MAIAILLCVPQAYARPADSGEFSSEASAKTFYELSLQIASAKDVNQAKAERAIIFLRAAKELDKQAIYVFPDMAKLIRQYSSGDQTDLVKDMLLEYTKKPIDFEVIKNAISYLLDKSGDRENRSNLTENMYMNLRSRNPYLDSELLSTLGFLHLEVADSNATNMFIMAYTANPYNRLVYAKLRELVPDKINALAHLEHLRLMLGENPLDLDAAMSFADFARRLELYQAASDAYKYCSDLYNYLFPGKPLPPEIYLPWSISDYNDAPNLNKCLQLASLVRQDGRFDLVLDAIAARAALKLSDSNQANQIFEQAEKKAKEIYNSNTSNVELAKKLAWYYCFARPDPNQASEWAAAAYSVEPNSPMAAALSAYSLLTKKQTEQAKRLAEKFQNNQISLIVMAKIALADSKPDKAAENLKTAIALEPGTLEAELAKKLLAALGQSYTALPNPEASLAMLKNSLKRALVPKFTTPDKILSFDLNVTGKRFSYFKDFGATLTISNVSAEPVLVSDNAIFTGRIRVDAKVSGDIAAITIPNLVNLKIEPTKPIEPGKNMLIDLNLMTGQLQQILLSRPQGSFQIDFTVYLDPVTTDGKVMNKLADIKPIERHIERTGEQITAQSLQYGYNSITRNYSSPKITAARLFAGLLAEYNLSSKGKISYKTYRTDNLSQYLKSGLLKCLEDNDPEVKIQTLAAMNLIPLDAAFTAKLNEFINPAKADWPVRLIAAYLLAEKTSNFRKVLDSTVRYDSDELVREMAVSFGVKMPPEFLIKPAAVAPKEPNKPAAAASKEPNKPKEPNKTDVNAIPAQSGRITK